MRLLCPDRASCDEAGFTLVEVLVSLIVATLIFMALAGASLAGVRGAVVARQNQQSVDVLTKAIEAARGLDYGSIAMVSSDLSVGDSSVNTGANPPTVTLPNVGTETVYALSTGSISPHVSTVTVNNNNYTLKRYVTIPSGVAFDANGFPSYVRFTAVVSWTLYGKLHTRTASTIITDTRRGLPLPNFTMKPVGQTAATQAVGTVVSYGFVVHNLGARDGFNITSSSGTWSYFVDADQNGVYNPSIDTTPLGNFDAASGNTAPDTGQMETNALFYVVAERTIATGESGTSTVTFTATSIAQPTASTATESVTDTLTVTAAVVGNMGNCPTPTLPAPIAGSGTTLTAFALNNGTVDGNTATQVWSPMTRADCTTQTADYNFSTDVSESTVGRILTPGGTALTTNNQATNQVADWRWQPSSTTTVAGTATVTVYVQCVTVGVPTLTAYVGVANNSKTKVTALTSQGSGAVTLATCGTSVWTPVTFQVPFASSWTAQVSKSVTNLIGLRIVSSTGSPDVRLNYDAPDATSVMYLGVAP